jgi:hypothetical protein
MLKQTRFDESVKTAAVVSPTAVPLPKPTELDSAALKQVGGGLSPNGTWGVASTVVQSPNGTW